METKDLKPSNVLGVPSNTYISAMPLKIVDTCTGDIFDSVEEASVIYEIDCTKLEVYHSEDFSTPTCLRYMAA